MKNGIFVLSLFLSSALLGLVSCKPLNQKQNLASDDLANAARYKCTRISAGGNRFCCMELSANNNPASESPEQCLKVSSEHDVNFEESKISKNAFDSPYRQGWVDDRSTSFIVTTDGPLEDPKVKILSLTAQGKLVADPQIEWFENRNGTLIGFEMNNPTEEREKVTLICPGNQVFDNIKKTCGEGKGRGQSFNFPFEVKTGDYACRFTSKIKCDDLIEKRQSVECWSESFPQDRVTACMGKIGTNKSGQPVVQWESKSPSRYVYSVSSKLIVEGQVMCSRPDVAAGCVPSDFTASKVAFKDTSDTLPPAVDSTNGPSEHSNQEQICPNNGKPRPSNGATCCESTELPQNSDEAKSYTRGQDGICRPYLKCKDTEFLGMDNNCHPTTKNPKQSDGTNGCNNDQYVMTDGSCVEVGKFESRCIYSEQDKKISYESFGKDTKKPDAENIADNVADKKQITKKMCDQCGDIITSALDRAGGKFINLCTNVPN